MMLTNNIVLEGKKVNKIYGHGKKSVHAVKDVDFQLKKGEIVSIVGESGSGKTTLAKMIMGLLPITEGDLNFNGEPRDIKSFKNTGHTSKTEDTHSISLKVSKVASTPPGCENEHEVPMIGGCGSG